MTDRLLEEVIKHATIANFDGELSSMVVLMVTKDGLPETHIAMNSKDYSNMNVAIDMLKLEMIRMIRGAMEEDGGKRE